MKVLARWRQTMNKDTERKIMWFLSPMMDIRSPINSIVCWSLNIQRRTISLGGAPKSLKEGRKRKPRRGGTRRKIVKKMRTQIKDTFWSIVITLARVNWNIRKRWNDLEVINLDLRKRSQKGGLIHHLHQIVPRLRSNLEDIGEARIQIILNTLKMFLTTSRMIYLGKSLIFKKVVIASSPEHHQYKVKIIMMSMREIKKEGKSSKRKGLLNKTLMTPDTLKGKIWGKKRSPRNYHTPEIMMSSMILKRLIINKLYKRNRKRTQWRVSNWRHRKLNLVMIMLKNKLNTRIKKQEIKRIIILRDLMLTKDQKLLLFQLITIMHIWNLNWSRNKVGTT